MARGIISGAELERPPAAYNPDCWQLSLRHRQRAGYPPRAGVVAAREFGEPVWFRPKAIGAPGRSARCPLNRMLRTRYRTARWACEA